MNSWLVSWFTMLRIGRTSMPLLFVSTRKIDMPSDFFLRFVERRGAREQDHQLGVLQARGPHLLAVDHVAVAFLHRDGLDLGGVGAGAGLGDAHGLQPQLAGRDLGQVLLLLLRRAVAQQGVHVVHLAVAAAGVAARARDFFHDHRRLGERQPGAAVFLGDQRRHPAGLGQRLDEGLGIGALLVDLLPVRRVELGAQLAHRVAQLGIVVATAVH